MKLVRLVLSKVATVTIRLHRTGLMLLLRRPGT
jgi:hypothetical protein